LRKGNDLQRLPMTHPSFHGGGPVFVPVLYTGWFKWLSKEVWEVRAGKGL